MMEFILIAVAGCSFCTSAAAIILVFRLNDILRMGDSVRDLIAEQTRLMRAADLRDRFVAIPPPQPPPQQSGA
jgi:hypothetical protein